MELIISHMDTEHNQPYGHVLYTNLAGVDLETQIWHEMEIAIIFG